MLLSARGARTSVILAVLGLGACADQGPVAPAEAPIENSVPAGAGAVSALRQGTSRYVVVGREGSSTDLRAAIAKAGGKVERTHGGINVYDVSGLSAQGLASLKALPGVEGVDADVRVQWLPPLAQRSLRKASFAQSRGTDQSGAAFFAYQWYLPQIRANEAWTKSRGGKKQLVCDLDSGVDANHLDLSGKVDLARSASFVAEEDGIIDRDSHGTAVSALIVSNGIGIASVAPDAMLCQVKVLNGDGSGSFADIIAGIIYATDAGADVINMSLGAYFSRREDGAKELVRAVQRAVNYASRHGVVVVAAAGNGDALGVGINLNRDPRSYIAIPAELDNVISVGATAPTNQQNFDQIASYSNYGASGVDVFAPGGDLVAGGVVEDLILTACSSAMTAFDCSSGADYLFAAGTSFASPLVSGEAAIIQSTLPGDQNDEVISRCILRSAVNPSGRNIDRLYGRGIVDVVSGLSCGGGRGNQVAAR